MDNASNEDAWLGIGHYLQITWKHKRLVLIFAALVIAATVVFTRQQPRIYEAVTQLVIDQSAPQYLPGASGQEVVALGTQNTWNVREYFETQYRILKSRMVGTMVVERTGLAHDLDFLGIHRIEDPAERARVLERVDPVQILIGRLTIEPVEDSNIVLVKVRDENPERAARLADAVCSAYGDANLDRKISFTGEAAKWLSQQVQEGKKELEAAEDALLRFKQANSIMTASLGDKQNKLGLREQDADRQLREARVESARLLAVLEQVRKLDPLQLQTSVEEVLTNSLVQRLKEQIVALQNERSDLLKRYLESHPDVRTADEKIARLEANLKQEVKGIQQSLERKYQAAQSTEQKLAAETAGIERDMKGLTNVELEYKRLEAAVESKRELQVQLALRLKEAQLQAEARANNVRILDRALVPDRPVSPRLAFNLTVAIVLALFGGLGLALLVESLDSSVKSQDQLEKELGLTFLGMVPMIKPGRVKKPNKFGIVEPVDPDRYVLDNPHSTAAECVRTVRTNLLFMSPGRPLRKLLVTSPGPREGKTSTCVNVSASMAMSGTKVLLIDTDLRRPRIHKVFDLANDRGLSNLVLEPEKPLDQVVQATPISNLDILCSGPIPPNPAELLHSPSFTRIMERLLERYDRVILDSPPVCVVTDALILGTQCDGAILVVRAGATGREMVKKARRLLADVKINILGALLNNVDVSRRYYGQYYHQYYRQHGGYYAEEPPAAEPNKPA